MRHLKPFLSLAISCLIITSANAQLRGLGRGIGNAVGNAIINKKVNEAIDGDKKTNPNNQDQGNSGNNRSKGNRTNNTGEELVSTVPDINKNLTDAEASFQAKNYGEARYAIQQAMLGVELEIGHQILRSMPNTISTLKKDTTEDKVSSAGSGWAGLTILREYGEGDKQFNITISNNSAWMNAINMYFDNAAAIESNNGKQKMKRVTVKNMRGLLEFEKQSGYKLSIPIGQTTLIIMQGINFANEAEILSAANQFDLEGIKKLLGEN